MDDVIDRIRCQISKENAQREFDYSFTTEQRKHELLELLDKSTTNTNATTTNDNLYQMSSFLDTMNLAKEQRDWWKLDKTIQREKIQIFIAELSPMQQTECQVIIDRFDQGKLKRSQVKYNKQKAVIEDISI